MIILFSKINITAAIYCYLVGRLNGTSRSYKTLPTVTSSTIAGYSGYDTRCADLADTIIIIVAHKEITAGIYRKSGDTIKLRSRCRSAIAAVTTSSSTGHSRYNTRSIDLTYLLARQLAEINIACGINGYASQIIKMCCSSLQPITRVTG